jgi:DNA-binding Lrp family transcriptional regulator
MASAFVLIKVEDGDVEEIRKNLEEMPEVEEHYSVLGMYEVLSLVKSETITDLQNHVSSTIDKIRGISTTLTLIIIDPEPEDIEGDITK